MESYKLCQICRAIDFKSLVYRFPSSSSSSSSSLPTNNDDQEGLNNADNSLQGELLYLSTKDETSAPRLSKTPHNEWLDPSSTQLIPRAHSYTTMLEGDDSFSLSENQSGDLQDSVLASPRGIFDHF